MWILLGILGFLTVLVTVILLLPVRIILKNDENNPLILRYKFLFKTFGGDPNPDAPIVKMLKSVTGADRLEGKAVQRSIRNTGLKKAVTETFATLAALLKEIVGLFKFCKITRLHIKIRCAGDDAAEAAIHYGQCCAAAGTLLNVLENTVRFGKRSRNIDIGCDYAAEKSLFHYDVILSIRVWRLLGALWKVAMKEAKRMHTPAQNQAK